MEECATADQPGAPRAPSRLLETGRPPRVWPAWAIIVLFWAFRFGGRGLLPGDWVKPATTWAAVLAAFGMAVWWRFFSRLRWLDRIVGLVVLVVAGAAALPLFHDSLKLVQRNGPAMFAVPVVITLIVAWLTISRWTTPRRQTMGLAIIPLAAWAGFLMGRVNDRGDWSDLRWRWSPTAEQKLLAERAAAGKPSEGPQSAGSLALVPGDWPEFRGPNRDNRVAGVRIETNWKEHPPQLVWKHPVGPGWSSFSVVGDVCFTQEQRGEEESTVCYRLSDGGEVWAHGDAARFWDAATGAGPRGVPTFHDGKIYTVGATGLVDCLDAATGQLLWQRNLLQDVNISLQQWGIATSPLVVGQLVVVFAGGGEGKGTIAYAATTGEPVWTGGRGTQSFSSPQLARLDGIEQVLMAHDLGLDALDPASGKLLWQYDWKMEGYGRMLQPCVLGDDRVVLAGGKGQGTRLLKVALVDQAWNVEELWQTKKLVPYYNDFVVYQGYAYGFDDNIFCCIDLATGERKWKEGRYGYGQVLLLAEQGLLLVLGGEGQLVLLTADPAGLKELASLQVLEGKSGNHPVVVRGKLLVRNADEMAYYQLPLEKPETTAAK